MTRMRHAYAAMRSTAGEIRGSGTGRAYPDTVHPMPAQPLLNDPASAFETLPKASIARAFTV